MNHERPTKPDAALLPREAEARLRELIEDRRTAEFVVVVFRGKIIKARVDKDVIEWQR